jgi:pimeloyl-ACP methyl ester carboxylesterase
MAIEPEVAQAQVEALPQPTLVAFDDLGHFGPLEAPASVAEAVATWFRSP